MLTIKTCRMDFAEEDCAARLGRLGLAALVLFGPFDNIEIVASRKTLAQSTRIVLRRMRLSPKIRWNSIYSPPPNTSTVRLRQCFTVSRGRKKTTQKQVRWQIHDERQEHQHRKDVQRRRSPCPMEKGIGINEIDIRFGRRRQPREYDHRNRYCALQNPTPTIVSDTVERPKKQKGNDHVKQR